MVVIILPIWNLVQIQIIPIDQQVRMIVSSVMHLIVITGHLPVRMVITDLKMEH